MCGTEVFAAFLAGFLVVLSVAETPSQPCPAVLSVDLTGGSHLSNQSILFDDLVFPKSSQYERDNVTWGCVCDVKTCIRKCCPPGHSFIDKDCRMDEGMAPEIYRYTTPSDKKPDFYILYGGYCEGGNEKAIMNPETERFFIQENGNLYVEGAISIMIPQDKFCFEYFASEVPMMGYINGKISVAVCATAYSNSGGDKDDQHIYYTGMIISMPFLLMTFIVYALLPERNIHGKCLMCYVITLFGAYVVLVTLQLNRTTIQGGMCAFAGFLCYFFFMVSFLWMNVMSIDIWWTFSGLRGMSGSKRKAELRKFLIYSAYAWGVPILMVGLVAVLSSLGWSRTISELAWYNPGVGEHQCWFKNGIPTFVFFYLPMTIIIISNVIFFVITSVKIKQVQRDTSMLRKDENKKHSLENDKQWCKLYLKLLLAMGVNWIMEIISWAVQWQAPETPKYVWYFTDFCNALYGVFIFFIFVFKQSIWKMLKRRYYSCLGKQHLARSLTQTGYSSRTRASSLNQTTTTDCKSYVDESSTVLTSQVA